MYRSRSLRSLFLSAICVLVLFSAVAARADWPAVTKDELNYKGVPGQPDAPAVVLMHDRIDDNEHHVKNEYYKIKILTDAGRERATVIVPFDRHGQGITDIKGRTTHADGTVVHFEGKPFDKEVESGSGSSKYHVKAFTLPDVQVGSVIEYSFAWRYDEHLVYAPTWELQNDLFQVKEHYRFNPSTGQLTNSKGEMSNGLAWVMSLPKGGEVKSYSDRYYELTLNNVPAYIDEEFSPPSEPYKYHVEFYYHFNTNTEGYWRDEGHSWQKNIQKFMERNGGVHDALAKLIQAGDSDDQKAKKIYAFVQGMENISYLPARSREEMIASGYKPNVGVEDVLQQKRGNRFDLARLFAEMCREAGLKAYMMWVTDRSETLFQPEYLETSQLDHELVLLDLNGKEKGFDPGTKYAPFGVVRWRYTASKGLRETPDGKVVIADSPAPTFGGDAIQRAGNFVLNEQGDLQGILVVRFYGQEGLSQRLTVADTDAAGRKKHLEDEIRRWLSSNADVTLTSEPNWAEYESPLTAQFKISTPALSGAGKRLLLASDFVAADRPPKFRHADRKNVIYFHFPWREIDQIGITVPASMTVEAVTPLSQASLPYASYKCERSQTGRTIITKRTLDFNGIAFPVSEFKTLKDFFDQVKQGDDQQAVLRSAANASN